MTEGASSAGIGDTIARLLSRSVVASSYLERELDLPVGVTLEDVLAGTYTLTPSDLVIAADVLGVPVRVLTGQLPTDRHLGVSLRLGVVDAPDVPTEALEYADMMLEYQALLDSWLGPPTSPLDNFPMSTSSYYKRAGEISAGRLRDALGLGNDPVSDLVGIVEQLGFPVAFRDLPDGLHGLNIRDSREGPPSRVVIISTRDYWTRQRYTLAHELCHGLYDDKDQIIVDRVDVPEVLPELRAESFARHFLLPSSALKKEVRAARLRKAEWSSIVAHLMLRWGISRTAILRALIDESLTAPDELAALRTVPVHTLMSQVGLLGTWDVLCEDSGSPSGSQLLLDRAAQAFSEGKVSVRVVADLLDTDSENALHELSTNGWLNSA